MTSEQALYQDSLRVLADVAEAGPFAADSAWCCFHFLSMNASEERWNESVQIAQVLFDAMPYNLQVDYVAVHVGIEAWEKAIPDRQWVSSRLPLMFEVAAKAHLNFVGWTFEPNSPRRIFQASP